MTIMKVERNDASAAFFDAAARGVLLLEQCTPCGALRAPRRSACRACGHQEATSVHASGAATLVTWASHPGQGPDDGPWLFAMVELAEGPWLESTLVDVPAVNLHIGLALQVRFVAEDGGETYPVFGPADAGKGRR